MAILVLSVAPLMAAAGPTTQPVDVTAGKISTKSDPTTRPDRLAGSDDGLRRNRLGIGMRGAKLDPGTRADWEGISGFMTAHSPNRLQFINGLADGPLKFGMMKNMLQKEGNLARLDKDDPELAGIMTSRVELEDQVFGLASQFRNADPEQADQIRQTLREKVADLVDTNMKERELRIDRLKKALAEQEQNLATDEGQRDRLVADRLRGIINEARRPNGPLDAAHSEPVLASPETSTDVTPSQKQK
jgi:hypothetical protein